MNSTVNSIGLEGMRGYVVTAEANVRDEKESCVIIGLPDAPMKESKERILSCLHKLDIDVSMKKITIHLSPANQRKTGTGHDCAMLVAVLYSIYKLAMERASLSTRPPYRPPHHSSSAVSLIGGGTFSKPGEISLAHQGILFLDDLGEFLRKSLDMLRQPIEMGEVTISRVRQTVHYPSQFILIATTNPCPCGYYGSTERYCTCTPQQIRSYQLKVSGTLFDRFDFILRLESTGLADESFTETSADIRERTTKARNIQRHRYKQRGINGTVAFTELMKHAELTKKQEATIKQVCFENKWSNRTYAKIIRIARSISDLVADPKISDQAIKEAIKGKIVTTRFQNETDEAGMSNG